MIAADSPSTLTQFTLFNLPVTEQNATRFHKMCQTRRSNTGARNERIRSRFNHLYNQERKRIDDVIAILCDEFNLAKSTIERALKS